MLSADDTGALENIFEKASPSLIKIMQKRCGLAKTPAVQTVQALEESKTGEQIAKANMHFKEWLASQTRPTVKFDVIVVCKLITENRNERIYLAEETMTGRDKKKLSAEQKTPVANKKQVIANEIRIIKQATIELEKQPDSSKNVKQAIELAELHVAIVDAKANRPMLSGSTPDRYADVTTQMDKLASDPSIGVDVLWKQLIHPKKDTYNRQDRFISRCFSDEKSVTTTYKTLLAKMLGLAENLPKDKKESGQSTIAEITKECQTYGVSGIPPEPPTPQPDATKHSQP